MWCVLGNNDYVSDVSIGRTRTITDRREKSQIQALDRTQPGLPIKKGRCGTMTHDHKRNGTATLLAALEALEGQVISMCDDRHRHQEWLRFLRAIDDAVPKTSKSI